MVADRCNHATTDNISIGQTLSSFKINAGIKTQMSMKKHPDQLDNTFT